MTNKAIEGEATRARILSVARAEFAARGYSGARVDRIAEKTKKSKRMLYYHFGSKKNLYIKVLEETYLAMRNAEEKLYLDRHDPLIAVRQLVEFRFEYYVKNTDYVRLIMGENMNDAKFLAESSVSREMHKTVIAVVKDIIERGEEMRVWTGNVDPVELHMTITALCFFNVSNRATFSRIFENDMTSAQARAERKQQILATILGRLGTCPPQASVPSGDPADQTVHPSAAHGRGRSSRRLLGRGSDTAPELGAEVQQGRR